MIAASVQTWWKTRGLDCTGRGWTGPTRPHVFLTPALTVLNRYFNIHVGTLTKLVPRASQYIDPFFMHRNKALHVIETFTQNKFVWKYTTHFLIGQFNVYQQPRLNHNIIISHINRESCNNIMFIELYNLLQVACKTGSYQIFEMKPPIIRLCYGRLTEHIN